jgi:hypothetical protein
MNKTLFAVLFLIFACASAFAQEVRVIDYTRGVAQNLAHKFAIGFNYITYRGFSGQGEVPALSVRYWLDDYVGLEGDLGFSSGKQNNLFYFGTKLIAIIKNYKALNIYALAFGGYGTAENNPVKEVDSAYIYKVGAGLGAEWFVLDNLSISSEIGVALFSNSNSDIGNSLEIYADWIPRAGVRFYF